MRLGGIPLLSRLLLLPLLPLLPLLLCCRTEGWLNLHVAPNLQVPVPV